MKELPWLEVSKICFNPKDERYNEGVFNVNQHYSPCPEDVIELKLVLKDNHIEDYIYSYNIYSTQHVVGFDNLNKNSQEISHFSHVNW